MIKEYIIITHSGIDVAEIDAELSNPSGNSYIPNRAVELAYSRTSSSRMTHWYITHEEAEALLEDPRILAVEQPAENIPGLEIVPLSRSREKGIVTNAVQANWGKVRVNSETNPFPGGDANNGITARENLSVRGRGVDIVIQDNLASPESGDMEEKNNKYSFRTKCIDWYEDTGYGDYLRSQGVEYSGGSNKYSAWQSGYLSHGSNVASIAAGAEYGWAGEAHVYPQFIVPMAFSPRKAIPLQTGMESLKFFHRNKPIDPETGYKRPTIVNMSWGFRSGGHNTEVDHIIYRGTDVTQQYKNLTGSQRHSTFGVARTTPIQLSQIDVAIEELVDEGIHVVIAAGNEAAYQDVPGGLDYNNEIKWLDSLDGSVTGRTVYYNRPPSPYHPKAINVGAIDNVDRFTYFSNKGPAVDIYAPGWGITGVAQGQLKDIQKVYDKREVNSGTASPYDARSRLVAMSGTSQASPQVCGVAALHLGVNPHLTPSELKHRLFEDSKATIVFDSNTANGGYEDDTDFSGGNNRFLYNRYNKFEGLTFKGSLGFKNTPATPVAYPSVSLTTINLSSPQPTPANPSATIVSVLKDKNGVAIPSYQGSFELFAEYGTINNLSTTSNGTYTATYTAPSFTTESDTVRFRFTPPGCSLPIIGERELFISGVVSSVEGSELYSEISANPVPNTTDQTSEITVTMRNDQDGVISNYLGTVNITTTAGSIGTVSSIGNGQFRATYTSPSEPTTNIVIGANFTDPGSNSITKTLNDIITFSVVDGSLPDLANSSISMSPVPSSINQTSNVTVTLVNAVNDVITDFDGTVNILATAGSVGSITDNQDGTYTATYTAPATPTTGVVVSATFTPTGESSPYTITDTESFNILGYNQNSTLSVSSSTVPADGTSTSTITLQVKDTSSNNVTTSVGTVTMESTVMGTIGTVTDNQNGTYTATFTAPTQNGATGIKAYINGDKVFDTVIIDIGTGALSTHILTVHEENANYKGLWKAIYGVTGGSISPNNATLNRTTNNNPEVISLTWFNDYANTSSASAQVILTLGSPTNTQAHNGFTTLHVGSESYTLSSSVYMNIPFGQTNAAYIDLFGWAESYTSGQTQPNVLFDPFDLQGGKTPVIFL